jgi:aryl-alcohol dehydrogenase-like predicted oxidoreductase
LAILNDLKWGLDLRSNMMKRRQFLKVLGAAGVGCMLPATRSSAAQTDTGKPVAKIPIRTLGRTGEKISAIVFGGFLLNGMEQPAADQVVAQAIAAGVNHFDVAPTYGDAESKLGPALQPYRNKVFLSCKTKQRDAEGAARELEQSLQTLRTDHFDLYQLHALTDVEDDVKTALGKSGAMEPIVEARKQGKIKYIGFSAHSPEAALAALEEFDFDTVMYPVNFACHYRLNFDSDVRKVVVKRNLGMIALKAMARQTWAERGQRKWYHNCWYEPIDDPVTARKALGWTLSREGVSVAVPPGHEDLFRMAMALAPAAQPPSDEVISELKDIAENCRILFDWG